MNCFYVPANAYVLTEGGYVKAGHLRRSSPGDRLAYTIDDDHTYHPSLGFTPACEIRECWHVYHGRVSGPNHFPLHVDLEVNRIRAVPVSDVVGKWRDAKLYTLKNPEVPKIWDPGRESRAFAEPPDHTWFVKSGAGVSSKTAKLVLLLQMARMCSREDRHVGAYGLRRYTFYNSSMARRFSELLGSESLTEAAVTVTNLSMYSSGVVDLAYKKPQPPASVIFGAKLNLMDLHRCITSRDTFLMTQFTLSDYVIHLLPALMRNDVASYIGDLQGPGKGQRNFKFKKRTGGKRLGKKTTGAVLRCKDQVVGGDTIQISTKSPSIIVNNFVLLNA